MRKTVLKFCTLAALSFAAQAFAADKVPLGEPTDEKIPLEEPKLESYDKELKSLPDGVLKVKTNQDGSFKSLIVKATVEIEDVLGGQKGKRLARKEAEIQCKRHLSQWLNENCVFAEASSNTRTILTKGESTKDAAGNTVTIRKQEGKEFKVLTENHAALSAACLKGLVVLHSEVTDDKQPEYALVMGLSQKTVAQAGSVKDALSQGNKGTGGQAPGKSNGDKPAPEKKVNPDVEDFLK